MCGGVSSGGRFRKVPEDSDVCWCRLRRQVPKVSEGSGKVPEGSGGFRCVPVCAGVGSGGRFRMQLPEGSGGFRRVWFVALQP